MLDFIRDYLPPLWAFLIFYAGITFGMLSAHANWALAVATFVAAPLVYITLAIISDRAQPKRIPPFNSKPVDIDLTW